jgi:hypothetical protein
VTWGGIIFHPKNMTPGIHQFALNSKDWLVWGVIQYNTIQEYNGLSDWEGMW